MTGTKKKGVGYSGNVLFLRKQTKLWFDGWSLKHLHPGAAMMFSPNRAIFECAELFGGQAIAASW